MHGKVHAVISMNEMEGQVIVRVSVYPVTKAPQAMRVFTPI